jgi:hypothetical protein
VNSPGLTHAPSKTITKSAMCPSIERLPKAFSFWLPGHKADQFFEGNQLIIQKLSTKTYRLFESYLTSHNNLFRSRPELWLCADGTISCLRHFSPKLIAGQSMHAGGATTLAECGTVPTLIQTAGRWSSNTFNCYVHKNPFLLEALLSGQGPHSVAFSI